MKLNNDFKNRTILIYHPNLGLGGAEKMIILLCNYLSSKYKVVLALFDNKELPNSLNSDIIVVRGEDYLNEPMLKQNFTSLISFVKKIQQSINKILKSVEPDVVLVFDLRLSLLCWLKIRRHKQIKLLFSERADPYENPLRWKIILFIIYRLCDGVIFQTTGAMNFYKELITKNKKIIPNPAMNLGNKVCIFRGQRKSYLFTVGRLQYRKGFDLLIESFEIVHKAYPEIELRIIGDGPERSNLEQLVDKLRLCGNVKFLGARQNPMELCKDASMFILPSRSEGIPNTLIEAQIYGIPCIATDCSPGGARVLIEDGVNGIIVPVNDKDSLAKAIVKLLDDVELGNTFSINGVQNMTKFTPDKIFPEWDTFIMDTLEN